jgi:hypothetical protein
MIMHMFLTVITRHKQRKYRSVAVATMANIFRVSLFMPVVTAESVIYTNSGAKFDGLEELAHGFRSDIDQQHGFYDRPAGLVGREWKKPSFLDCLPPDYDDDWVHYRQALRDNDDDLVAAAQDPLVLELTFDIFRKYSGRMRHGAAMVEIALGETDATQAHSFCPLGFSVALIIEYLANPSEKAGNVKLAQNVLGIGGMFSLFGGSWWPLELVDVLLQHHRIERLALPGAENDPLILFPFAFADAYEPQRDAILRFHDRHTGRVSSLCQSVGFSNFDAATCAGSSDDFFTRLKLTGQAGHSFVTLGIVGTHAALSQEPATALRDSIPEIEFGFTYFGNWAWCSLIDACGEPVSQIFEEYQEGFPLRSDDENIRLADIMVQRLGQYYRDYDPLRMQELFICTRPFYFCHVLRHLVGDIPMIHYYSGPLLFDTPRQIHHQILQAFRYTHLHSSADAILSTHVLQSSWMLSQTGVAPPIVRPHGLYLNATWNPAAALVDEVDVVILRSTFLTFASGIVFTSILSSLIAANAIPVKLTHMLHGDFLSYEDILQKDAALFLPDQPDKLTFWEFYSSNMPMLMPAKELYVSMHGQNVHDSCHHEKWVTRLDVEIDSDLHQGIDLERLWISQAPELVGDPPIQRMDWGPDWARDCPTKLAYFLELTDYMIFPGIQLFSSILELLEIVTNREQMLAASRTMDDYNRKTWKETRSFYRHLYAQIMQK